MTHGGILRIIYPNKQTPFLLDKMTQLWYRRKPSSFLTTTIPVFSHLHVLFRVCFSSAFYKIAWMKIHQNLVNKLQDFFCPQMQPFLLGYILYCQRSLWSSASYWCRISHKLSDCVHSSVLSNHKWFSLTSCIKCSIRVWPVFLSSFFHSPVRCGI